MSAGDWLAALLDLRHDVTVFLAALTRLPAQWRIATRVLPEHLIYFAVDGQVAATVQGQSLHLGPNSALWLQPGVEHAFRYAAGTHSGTLVHLRFRLLRRGRDLVLGQRWLLAQDAGEARVALEQFADEQVLMQPYHHVVRRAVLAQGCAAILRAIDPAAPSPRTFSPSQRRILQRAIAGRVADRPGPADLAALVGLSSDYFTRMFRQTFGLPPRAYLLQARMDAARVRLTESRRPIAAIAADLGYDDVFLFSRQFKRATGVSPRRYRQTH